MDEGRDDRIKKLIQEAGVYKPSSNFTDSIMNQIKREEAAQENALYSLLQSRATEQAPADFLSKVMSKLPVATNTITDKPPIGKFGWWAIAASFIAIVLFVLMAGQGQESLTQDYWKSMSGSFSGMADNVYYSSIALAAVLALALLVSIDRIKSAGYSN